MLIVSKFRDYYDTALGFGVDKSLLYNRVNEPGSFITAPGRWKYGIKEEIYNIQKDGKLARIAIRTQVFPLIFCGKFYKRALATVSGDGTLQVLGKCSFTASSRKEVLRQAREYHGVDVLNELRPRFRNWVDPGQVSFKEFANSCDWYEYHRNENCPVFLIRPLNFDEERLVRGKVSYPNTMYRIEKNPCLKDLGFYQIKNPYETFQEIAMFLGGVMGADARPMVQLSDKEVHQKHGFDKWSFRKMSERSK